MAETPYSEIEAVHITDLSPAAYNPRNISDQELKKLARSIETFGFVEPVVVNRRSPEKGWSVNATDDEGNLRYKVEDLQPTIVGGHQRVKAAMLLDWERVPVVWVDLKEPDEVALNIALNKIQGVWNEEKLIEAFELMRSYPDFDPEISGFEVEDMNALVDTFEIEPPSDFPEVNEDIETDYRCPSCNYSWSGDPKPKGPGTVPEEEMEEVG